MKRQSLLVSALVIGLSTSAMANATASKQDTVNQASYLMGYHAISNFKQQKIPVNTQQFIAGVQAAIHGKSITLSQTEQAHIMQEYQKMASDRMHSERASEGAKNLQAGEAFLAKVAKESDIKTLPGGILYKVVTEGHGDLPTATDTVTVNYEGKLIDGTVFDSSYKRGQPATFKLNQVIKGWTEALQHMPTGSTWMIYLPSNLAYGKMGTPGGPIGPDATLIFKVELISIKK